MGGRDADWSNGPAFESAQVDEASGLVPFGILKHAPGTGLAGLRGTALCCELVHACADGGRFVATSGAQHGREHHRAVQLRAVAIKGIEAIAARGAHLTLGRKPFNRLHDVEDPATHCTSVHPQGAANCAGNTFEELEAFPAFTCGETTEFLEAGATADAEAALAEISHGTPMGRVEMQDESVIAFVGHE